MKVILDTDPGIDDALAFILLKAMPEIELKAITTTHGNTTVQKCTDNALRLVELLGMQDIPVAEGAHEPLVKALSVAANSAVMWPTYVYGFTASSVNVSVYELF